MILVQNKKSATEVMHSMISELVKAGKFKILSSNGVPTDSIDANTRYCVISYIDTSLPDNIYEQPIRIRFEWNDNVVSAHMGTDTSIDIQGTIFNLERGSLDRYDHAWFHYNLNRDGGLNTPEDNIEGMNLSAFASYTPYGMTFAIWDQTSVMDGCNYSWFVLQRPVFPDGTPYVEDRTPVVCVFSSAPREGSEVFHFIVREIDVNVPSKTFNSSVNFDDSVAFFNSKQQVAIAPSRRFVLFFPCGFNTQRYYYNYELDLVAYTSADVLSMDSIVIDDRFGGKKRSYRALPSNGKFNTGMRVCFYNGEIA